MWFRAGGGVLARILRGAQSASDIYGAVKGNASVLAAAADEGFSQAIDMCGNQGQVSVIELTGWDAFYAGAEEALGGGNAEFALLDSCPYPEAVSEILGEAGAVIDDYVATVAGQEYVEGWEGYRT